MWVVNYPQARRKARTVFGKEGDARLIRIGAKLFKATYTVGIVRDGKFLSLGAGNSWEEAFKSVSEVLRGEDSEGEVKGDEGKATDTTPDNHHK